MTTDTHKPARLIKPSDLKKPAGNNGRAASPDISDEEMGDRKRFIETQLKDIKSGILPFPEHIFPEAVQRLMKVFYTSSGLPFEYYYAALLGATSILIGNKYRIVAKSDFIQPQLLYLVIVGKSGLGKSPPIKTIFAPLYGIEEGMGVLFHELHEAWARRKAEAKENKIDFDEPEPKSQRLLIGEATIESVFEILSNNPMGIGMVDEELSGWLEGMGQYKSGKSNELQKWLKLYDNPRLETVDRSGGRKLMARHPNCTIFGGVQPYLLSLIATGKSSAIGLSSRFMFVVPEKEEVPPWSEEQPDGSVFQKYNYFMKFLHEMPSLITKDEETQRRDIERIDLHMSREAKALYVSFYEKLRMRMNDEEGEKEFSQLSKLRGCCLRYALVLEIMHFAADRFQDDKWLTLPRAEQLVAIQKHEIGTVAMSGAIALVDYFISTSMTVLARFDNVLNTYPPHIRAWYNSLPDTFKGRYAVELGEKAQMSKSTVYDHLNKVELFKKDLATGMICKRIVTE